MIGNLFQKSWEELKLIGRLAVYHPLCKGCGAPLLWRGERHVCPVCREKIRFDPRNWCRRCGRYLEGQAHLCGECAASPPPFLLHASYAPHVEPLKKLIHQYKYGGAESLKEFFTALYLDLHARHVRQWIDLVVPVPADATRHRDFQPVAAMAQLLAQKLALPYAPCALQKVRPTPPQAGLKQAERIKNLKGAFRCRPSLCLASKTVLLIDDVYTTGTTLRACASELERAGARTIALTLSQSSLGIIFP